MAGDIKYCRKCGTQAEKDAKFCPNCGNPFTMAVNKEEPQPQKIFCRQCGKEIAANAKFCRYCGYRAGDALNTGEAVMRNEETVPQAPARRKIVVPPKPAAQQKAPVQQKASAQRKAPAQRKASGKGGGKRGLALVLAFAVFVVTAFYYPGFLVKEKKPGSIQTAQNTKPSQTSGKKTDSGKTNKAEEEAAEVMSVFDDTSGVSIGWSSEETAKAPAEEEAVSPEESSAQCGQVRVEFNGWNLPGDDRVTVRELPEKTDKAAGVTAKAYDFSLASGRTGFPTYVDIYIPRDDPDEIGVCEYYNAKSGAWEETNYRISEDQSAYIIRTKHFSLYRRLKLTEEALAKIKTAKLKTEDLKDEGVYDWLVSFREYWKDSAGNHQDYAGGQFDPRKVQSNYMNMPVEFVGFRGFFGDTRVMQWDAYWAAMEAFQKVLKWDRKDSTQIYAKLSEILGYVGLTSDSGSAANLIPDTPFWKGAGALLYLVGVLTTALQMDQEMSQGRGFWDYTWNHKMDAVGLAVGAVGTVVAFIPGAAAAATGVYCALIGVALYGYAKMYDEISEKGRELSIPERLYRDYYASPFVGQRAFFFEEPASHSMDGPGSLPRSAAMEDAEYKVFKQTVNEVCGGLKGSYCEDGGNKFSKPDYSWATAISKLFELYESKPDKLQEAVLDLYESYALAFWTMESSYQRAFALQAMRDRGLDGDAYKQVEQKIQQEYVRNMVADMMGAHIQLFQDLSEEYIYKAESSMREVVTKEVLPALNAPMYFVLPDAAAAPDVPDLRESGYFTALKDIKENKELMAYDPEAFADFNEAVAPLRFALEIPGGGYELVKEPCFLPAHYAWTEEAGGHFRVRELRRGDATWYYPFNEGFIPQEGNQIFTCTYYHYLMMGAPTVLVLHDHTGKLRVSDIALHFEVPEPDEDGSYTITIGGDGVALYSFNGDYLTNYDNMATKVRIRVDGYRQIIDLTVDTGEDKVTSQHVAQTFKFDPKKKTLTLLPGDNMFNKLLEPMTFYYVDENTLWYFTGGDTPNVLKRMSMEDDDDD